MVDDENVNSQLFMLVETVLSFLLNQSIKHKQKLVKSRGITCVECECKYARNSPEIFYIKMDG
jgi:hypothetical protein